MPHPLTLHRRNPWLACARQRQAASTTSARHVRCRAAQKSGNQSSSSSTTTTTTTDASPRSALTLAVAMAAAAAPVTYSLLSRVEQLPSLLQLQQAAQALVTLSLGGGALALGALKLQHGDKFHLELHRGRVHLQLGVPSAGPAVPPGCVVTRPTGDVRGNGAFAAAALPSGAHIGDYSGEVLTNTAFFERYPDGVADYVMAIDQANVVDAAAHVASTEHFHPVHMNHSRTRPNVVRYYRRSEGRVSFFAARDIQAGEELLFDYGRDFWRGREHLELP